MADSILVKKTQIKPKVNKKSDVIESPANAGIAIREIKKQFKQLTQQSQVSALEELGVGYEYFTCQYCGSVKPKIGFYVSTEQGNKSGYTRICKKCASDLALYSVEADEGQPTKQSVDLALYYLNKPYFDSVWQASMLEAANTSNGKSKNNVWTSYIKNIQMRNYQHFAYRDSDGYNGGILSLEEEKKKADSKDQIIIEEFEKNKSDTLRLLGYLPFDSEKITDQPFLYSQLIGFLDASEEGNDDMMKIQSIISIVRGFLQISQIDDMIAKHVADQRNVDRNIATIKSLQQMKQNITMGVTKLAEQSCISLKNSKNSIKGENTWTGKIKKIKDMNLREGEVNGFDINTCKGMQQVQEISDASIMKQLALDESEWSDMVAEMRTTIVSLRKDLDAYKEINRILLRENLDLKDYMIENNVIIKDNVADLKDLYSVFNGIEEDQEEDLNDE